MHTPKSVCSVCQSSFQVRFRYQVRETNGQFQHFCSQACEQQNAGFSNKVQCNTCNAPFTYEFAFQAATLHDGSRAHFCSTQCRESFKHTETIPTKRIAVFNHKGGTAKTTTAINLAAGLAESGKKVLLVDADGQGNVGAALGIRGERTLYHVLVEGARLEDVAVPVRTNLDVITSSEMLAAAELFLAKQPNRHAIMRDRLGGQAEHYDSIVIDCAPALSLMNQNALIYADSVIIPVSCDYMSLIGVKQVLRTMKNVREALNHPLQLLGVLPTFYDVRNRICRESMDALRRHFEDRCLPPIRVNTKLKEAPTLKQSIFEYASNSPGALDYFALVKHVQRLQQTDSPVSISDFPTQSQPFSIPTTTIREEAV